MRELIKITLRLHNKILIVKIYARIFSCVSYPALISHVGGQLIQWAALSLIPWYIFWQNLEIVVYMLNNGMSL